MRPLSSSRGAARPTSIRCLGGSPVVRSPRSLRSWRSSRCPRAPRDHADAAHHRVRAADARQRARRHHRGPRRQPLVHRGGRAAGHRPHHHERRDHRVHRRPHPRLLAADDPEGHHRGPRRQALVHRAGRHRRRRRPPRPGDRQRHRVPAGPPAPTRPPSPPAPTATSGSSSAARPRSAASRRTGEHDEFNAGLSGSDTLNDITERPRRPAVGHDRGRRQPHRELQPLEPRDPCFWSTGLTGAPNQIVAASDGKLYFTESDNPAAIGRIKTDGNIKEYRNGLTADSRPAGIAEGGEACCGSPARASPGRIGRLDRQARVQRVHRRHRARHRPHARRRSGRHHPRPRRQHLVHRERPARQDRPRHRRAARRALARQRRDPGARHTIDDGVLKATVSANSQDTTYYVEYGPDEQYGTETEEQSAGHGADPIDRERRAPARAQLALPRPPRRHQRRRRGAPPRDLELWTDAARPHQRLRSAGARPAPTVTPTPTPTPDARARQRRLDGNAAGNGDPAADARRPRSPRRCSARPSSSARSAARSGSRRPAPAATARSPPAPTCRSARWSTRAPARSSCRARATPTAARRTARSGAASSRSARAARARA